MHRMCTSCAQDVHRIHHDSTEFSLSNMTNFCNERFCIFVIQRGSCGILDSDHSDVEIGNGRKGNIRKIEGSSSRTALRATINDLHWNGSMAVATIPSTLNSEALATVLPIVPDVRVWAVASCCEDHVWWDLVRIEAKTSRGKKWGCVEWCLPCGRCDQLRELQDQECRCYQ